MSYVCSVRKCTLKEKHEIKDKEKNENSIDEAAPFTGHSDLALPILNYEK